MEPLAAVDLDRWLGTWPMESDVRGRVTGFGPLESLRFDGALSLGGEAVAVGGRLSLNPPSPGIELDVRTSSANLERLARGTGLGGSLAAWLSLTIPFDENTPLAARSEASVANLSVDGKMFGELRSEGRIDPSGVRINAELEGYSGKAALYASGRLDDTLSFTGDVFLSSFDLVGFLGGSDLPRSAVQAATRFQASGDDAESLQVEAAVYLAPSILGSAEVDTGVVRLRWRDRGLLVDEGRIASGSARLESEGRLVFDESNASDLRVNIDAPRLDFSGKDLRIRGAGLLSANAQLTGNVARPRLRANARVSDLDTKRATLASAEGNLDVQLDEHGRVDGTLGLQLVGLAEPASLDSAAADILLEAKPDAQHFRLRATADDATQGVHRLSLHGMRAPDRARVDVDQVRLGTMRGEWTLEAPAALTFDRGSWELTPFRLVSEERSVTAAGTLPAKGAIDLRAAARGIDLAFLSTDLEANGAVAGIVDATLVATGTAASPRASFRARVESLRIGTEPAASLEVTADLGDGEASALARYDRDERHWLEARASVPVEVDTRDLRSSSATGPLSGTIDAPRLPLALAAPFTADTLRNLGGSLGLDLDIGGRIAAPTLSGTITAVDGTARVVPLQVDLEKIEGVIDVAADGLSIRELRARSGKGRIEASGTIELVDLRPASYDLTLQARRWPAIQTARYQARVGANLRLLGTQEEPELSGRVTVEDAFLKPDLRFLDASAGPAELDPTITVIDSNRPSFAADDRRAPSGDETTPSLPERVRADVVLVIDRGTRVRHDMADVEVTGELRIRHVPGNDVAVTGKVESVRGTVEIQGREFRLERGVVRFTGGDVTNPQLDVLARHRRSPYVIDATIGGTVREPTLELSSQPVLDQADILAVLLFGRPASRLDEGEKTTLQQQALSVTSGYAASVLGQAVSESLGLESLGIELRDVDYTGGRVGIGRYVTENTYVSVTQQIGEEHGRQVEVEYFLTPNWKIVTSTDSLGTSGVDVIWQALY